MEKTPFIETIDLKKYFHTPKGELHAIDGVNLKIYQGETLGVVGESGCGKSTLGRLLLRLLDASEGKIVYRGEDLLEKNRQDLFEIRKNMQMIFQDPYACLNPRLTVSEIIAEPLKVCKVVKGKRALQRRVEELMETVGLAQRFINTYPHEMDGGRRQRVGIARALALNPAFLVCDEPVSALDVSIQAQILNLLMDLQEEKDLTYMFITHDLSVVKHISSQIAVMYLGKCVELAATEELFHNPKHPYTKALLEAIPRASLSSREREIEILSGEVVSPINPKPGCRFHSRCPYAEDLCLNGEIPMTEIGEQHFVACIRSNEKEIAV